MATLLEAQGQVERARQYWRQVLAADQGPDGSAQTQRLLDGLDTEKGQYDELVGGARQILRISLSAAHRHFGRRRRV